MADRDSSGLFLPGNHVHRLRTHKGGHPIYADPMDLWTDCCEYFEWVQENPLHEAKAFAYEGVVTLEEIPKARAMTIGGLCIHLKITPRAWEMWRKDRDDLKEIIEAVENVIKTQKFELAAADLLNANLIARDLGLANKQELTSPDGSMTPAVTVYQLPDNGRD